MVHLIQALLVAMNSKAFYTAVPFVTSCVLAAAWPVIGFACLWRETDIKNRALWRLLSFCYVESYYWNVVRKYFPNHHKIFYYKQLRARIFTILFIWQKFLYSFKHIFMSLNKGTYSFTVMPLKLLFAV